MVIEAVYPRALICHAVSEKAAIAKAIEEEMVDRQGERTDLELLEKFPEVKGRELHRLERNAKQILS